MKNWFLLLFLMSFNFFSLTSCDNETKVYPKGPVRQLSKDQVWLYNIDSRMKSAYRNANNNIEKKEVKEKYADSIMRYAKNRNYLFDSIIVTVRKIDVLSETAIGSYFEDRVAEYKFIYNFKIKPDDRDSIYRHLKSFRDHEVGAISSFFIIGVKVNDINDYMTSLTFEAIPVPLTVKRKHK